jgi:hypothetical protein
MSAPVLDTAPAGEIPDGAAPIVLPVMVIEGLETSDRRYIEPGTIEVRDLPIPLYAATRSTHGDTGDAATWHVGAITSAERIPGPDAKLYGGASLPEGTFAWVGRGWMYHDVPAAPAKSAYQLVKDRALRGNSVDMTEVVAEFQGPNGELADQSDYSRISMQRGVIAATTLVGIPAFAGAYITLDGTDMVADAGDPEETLAASAAQLMGTAPTWLSADIGDLCHGCQVEDHLITGDLRFPGGAGNGLQASTAAFDFEDDGVFDPGAAEPARTDGMVALVPANPQMLVAPGGDPAEQLHLTLAYLGDEVDSWEPEMVAAVHAVARRMTDLDFAREEERRRLEEAGLDPDDPSGVTSMSGSQAQQGPLEANLFAHAVFNANGDNGHDPATVYLLDGKGDREAIEWLRNDIVSQVRNAIGDVNFPEQHQPFLPHVTAGYKLDPSQLTYTGPVTFDRIRVAIADDVTDYPLGGGDAVLVASAADLPHVSVFADPKLSGPTPWTVTDDGRVFGHLALWNTCHTGITDVCRTPPRSATNYAYFRVHGARARQGDGTVTTVPVGYATVSRAPGIGGHAGVTNSRAAAMSVAEVAAHYDNTCTAAAELAAGEDEFGIWVAGRLMPGLDDDTAYKVRGAALSGDWRRIRGSMELMAALAVNTPGFPVPWRSLVASGAPQVILAAGAQAPSQEAQQARVDSNVARLLGQVQDVFASELDAVLPSLADLQWDQEVGLLLALDADHPWFTLTDVDDVPGWEGTVGPFSGQYTDPHVYARDVHSGAGNCVCGSDVGHKLHVQAAPGIDIPETMRYGVLLAAGRKVLHLPPYIKRIKKHLEKKGMATSRAIATAVNAAKKMCSTGDLNFPGSQQVNPGSRAEACAAVAQWKKDRPGATG